MESQRSYPQRDISLGIIHKFNIFKEMLYAFFKLNAKSLWLNLEN